MHKMHFPLPRAKQEQWTKWYNHIVTSGALKQKTIVWAAEQLPCRFKSDQVKDVVGPHHVFILKLQQKFYYALIDSTETVYKLPKKYYTACFPGIQYNQVPKNNRFKVKLTGRKTIELPFIPESFLEQKKNKTQTRKRRRSETQHENIQFDFQAPQWSVLMDQPTECTNKKNIFHLIRSIVAYADKNEQFRLKNEFENITVDDIQTNDDLRTKMKTIISFIYFYCREEMGMFPQRPPMTIDDLQSWIADLNES